MAYGGRKDETFVALLTILGNASSMLRQLILQHFCHKNLQTPLSQKFTNMETAFLSQNFANTRSPKAFVGILRYFRHLVTEVSK